MSARLRPEDLEPVERYFLMLLFAPDSSERFAAPVKGKTWLQKEMFLLSKLRPELESEVDYEPHLMGSYSEVVDETAYQFAISGYTEKIGDAMKLSLDGKKFAEGVWEGASDEERRAVTDVKMLLNDLSQWELFGLIYSEFPDMAINSEKHAEVIARRLDIAIRLLMKGKIPVEKAATIAHKPLAAFLQILKARHVSLSQAETRSIIQDRTLMEEIRGSREDSRNRRLVAWKTIETSV